MLGNGKKGAFTNKRFSDKKYLRAGSSSVSEPVKRLNMTKRLSIKGRRGSPSAHLMTMKFEEFISDYALMRQRISGMRSRQVLRAFFFGNGTREYIITITPEGLIRASHTKYPAQLSIRVTASLWFVCRWLDG